MFYCRAAFVFIFVFSSLFSFAQSDSSNHGTIRIAKPKKSGLFIAAFAEYDVRGKDVFQPFPVVEGHSFPFNYTQFFHDSLKNKKIDLGDLNADTVYIEVLVTRKGNVKMRDITSIRKNYRNALNGDNDNKILYLLCVNELSHIKKWFPAYRVEQEVGKFKGSTVIRPVKTNLDSKGIITVVFSGQPFDE